MISKHIGFLFVLLTYILTWSVEIPQALSKHGYKAINISKGLQTVCTLSPGVVALILAAIFFKRNGLKTLLKSALWEEMGRRGFLLPILQEKYTPLKASIVIGFVWGLWHLPIYFAINPYGDKTFSYFLFMFIGCFAISIIATWLYNSTKGSLFICILFHNAINTSAAYFYGNLQGNEFRPLIIFIVLLMISAIFICVKTKGALDENGLHKVYNNWLA